MAGGIVSALGGEGPGGGGMMDVMLPLAMGVAAAAHPALARGAHAITTSMAAAGRNRRLRDVVQMEKSREERAAEQYKYGVSRRPVKEAKENVGGTFQMPGGGIQQVDYSTGAPVLRTVRPPFSPEYQEAVRTGHGLETEGAVGRQKALMPGQLDYAQKTADITYERQKKLQQEKPPMNENTALGRIMQIENQMAQDIQKFRSTKNEEEEYPTEAQVEAYVRQAHARYAPEVQSLYGYMPKGYHKRTFMDAPPLGYIRSNYTDPQLGQVWVDPADPGNRAKWWVPKVPWSGGLY